MLPEESIENCLVYDALDELTEENQFLQAAFGEIVEKPKKETGSS